MLPSSSSIKTLSCVFNKINSVISLFPEKRKELASIALGSKAEQDIGYYASIHQKAETKNNMDDITTESNDFTDFSSNAWKVITEDAQDQDDNEVMTTIVKSTPDATAVTSDLTIIIEDLKQRPEQDTSGQLKQGVQKFCQRYQQMSVQKFSNNRIASAFNCFGWVFGGNITSIQGGILRRGRRIAVQVSAAGR